ncbi:MAG: hypothetical protein WAW11_05325 [Patescibacteria group bacterium]
MDKLIYALVILVIVAIASYWLWRVHTKIKNALIGLMVELIASTSLDVFCREIKNIPVGQLNALDDKEKEAITDYLRYMVRSHLHFSYLLTSMAHYELGAKKKKFITDYLFQALGVQGSAVILADIIYNDVLGVGNNEKEKQFILNRCGTVLEFQDKTIKQLELYQNSPMTKGFEALAISKGIEKLRKQFKGL